MCVCVCLCFVVERRRRFNINDRIKELGALIPKSSDPSVPLLSFSLLSGFQLIFFFFCTAEWIPLERPFKWNSLFEFFVILNFLFSDFKKTKQSGLTLLYLSYVEYFFTDFIQMYASVRVSACVFSTGRCAGTRAPS